MVKQYLDHCKKILTSEYSDFKGGSKGSGLISLPGHQNEYDLRNGFPLLTTKKMEFESVAHELIWFMKGDTNIKYLEDNKVPIWRKDVFKYHLDDMVEEGIFPKCMEKYTPEWEGALKEFGQMIREDKNGFADRWGDAGPIYGKQWMKWEYFDTEKGKLVEIDQLGELIEKVRKKPTGKKHLVSAWNPGDVPRMSLPPCHVVFQVHGNENGQLDLQLAHQRSCDQFLGVPYNIASYSTLLKIIAQETYMEARRFIHSFGDAHFYSSVTKERSNWYGNNFNELQERVKEVGEDNNSETYSEIKNWINKNAPEEAEGRKGYDHVTAILEQLDRDPRELPKLEITKKPFNELTIDDFKVTGYDPHPAIRRNMCV